MSKTYISKDLKHFIEASYIVEDRCYKYQTISTKIKNSVQKDFNHTERFELCPKESFEEDFIELTDNVKADLAQKNAKITRL